MVLWGPARQRQDHPGARHRRGDQVVLRAVQCRPRERRRAARDRRRGAGSPGFPAAAHDRVRRRDSSVQQGPAGRVPAPRGGRDHRAGRRDDREPVVRRERGSPVALQGVPAGAARRRRTSFTLLRRALHDSDHGLGGQRSVGGRRRPARHRGAGPGRRAAGARPRSRSWPTTSGRAGGVTRRRATSAQAAREPPAAPLRQGGEEHYNVVSAFIKSMRGTDPDAAIYWMMRMLEAGDDPLFVSRRMLDLRERGRRQRRPAGARWSRARRTRRSAAWGCRRGCSRWRRRPVPGERAEVERVQRGVAPRASARRASTAPCRCRRSCATR